MEIIRHGKTYDTAHCEICNCYFGYSAKDIHYNGTMKEVRCPDCSHCQRVGKIND